MRKWLFLAFIVIAVSFGAFFASSGNSRDDKPLGIAALAKTAFHFITDASETLKGEPKDRTNALILGLPGEQNEAPYLTDGKTHAKINALYLLGGKSPELIRRTMEELTGQPLHYFAALDISSIEQVVDALGGLNVAVPEDVYDPAFPTPGHGTEVFAVQKGWRHFDGTTAQKFLRTRHGEGGDFARMRRQQAVIEALRKRVFGLNMLYDFPALLSLYKTVHYHIQTDIDENKIRRFYDIAKNISYATVRHEDVDGDPKNPDALLESATFTLEGKPAFVLKPKTGDFDYKGIQELAENIFGGKL